MKKPENQGKRWSIQDEKILGHMFEYGASFKSMANNFGRSEYAVVCKLKALGYNVHTRPKEETEKPANPCTEAVDKLLEGYSDEEKIARGYDVSDNELNITIASNKNGIYYNYHNREELLKQGAYVACDSIDWSVTEYPNTHTKTEGKTTMKKDSGIYTKQTLVFGQNVAEMSEGQIIEYLERIDTHIATLYSVGVTDEVFGQKRDKLLRKARTALIKALNDLA